MVTRGSTRSLPDCVVHMPHRFSSPGLMAVWSVALSSVALVRELARDGLRLGVVRASKGARILSSPKACLIDHYSFLRHRVTPEFFRTSPWRWNLDTPLVSVRMGFGRLRLARRWAGSQLRRVLDRIRWHQVGSQHIPPAGSRAGAPPRRRSLTDAVESSTRFALAHSTFQRTPRWASAPECVGRTCRSS